MNRSFLQNAFCIVKIGVSGINEAHACEGRLRVAGKSKFPVLDYILLLKWRGLKKKLDILLPRMLFFTSFDGYSQTIGLDVRDPMDAHTFCQSYKNACNFLRATTDVEVGISQLSKMQARSPSGLINCHVKTCKSERFVFSA